MILAMLLLQASAMASPAPSGNRDLYEPYRQCLLRQAPLLAASQGEDDSGLDQARSRCLSENLSAGSAALIAETRAGTSQSDAVDRVAALRNQVEQEVVATVRANHGDAAPADPAAKSEPPATLEAVSMGTINIPEGISPAIMPYMGCLFASRGTNLRLDPGEPDPRPPGVAVAADCSAQRAEAARRADDILRARHRLNAGRRRALIEETLSNVDRFVMPGGAVPSRPAGAMGSIDIPYQAIPAYRAYAECVGEHFSADPRHGNANPQEVRQANTDAIAACRDVRAQQLARALSAQTDHRMYGSADNARAAVRRAFDRFDSDYEVEAVTDAYASPAREQ